ncbi:hypothetical protein ABFS82_04G102200 [Erythranthe guttata]|uniref:Myb-like domain-containing protein n=1 Tax=Erythranthe guttata TaxID=4155 RepID=A0A022Q7K9_ERYGU|nr:PREDICTED: trihelix transcription factor ASIL2-like [Erythranthe guttata]EYU24687.1 hypothetical protein MIMGU_mgv1a026942mg [Erythranthe guttata]|eukprot:XP_012852810.1 PREDICTED: trihelix transcription factor ASIL2-like [Erythranthe guttata]
MMNDDEDDASYHANTYSVNSQKFPIENPDYDDDDDSDDDDVDDDDKGIVVIEQDDDDEDDDDEGNGIQRIGKDDYECGDVDEDENEGVNSTDLHKHPKKRKLKTLLPSYEFAPRAPPVPPPPPAPKPPASYGGGRNPLTDWTEHETFTLLDSWGERYLKQGRKSLRSEEWQEVSEKVSQESKLERTDTQCRNRLDTLKKKYKKEKSKPNSSEWVYFKKIDSLLSTPPPPNQTALSCGVDSGEYVFTNPRAYLNRSNGFDEMRDSPGNSGSAEGGGNESEGLPPKRARNGRVKNSGGGGSFKILADSFQKFSKIYEKIEDSKRKQMVELEKMRMDFHRDLEMQKRQILERAQAEIAKIWQGDDDDEENTVSAENVSG